MTHEYETKFHETVHDFFVNLFGEENVHHEVYLKETGRYADFVVETGVLAELLDGPECLAVEVENDFESVATGIGQAALYAGHYDSCKPVVIVPEGHVEEPEITLMRKRHTILEI